MYTWQENYIELEGGKVYIYIFLDGGRPSVAMCIVLLYNSMYACTVLPLCNKLSFLRWRHVTISDFIFRYFSVMSTCL